MATKKPVPAPTSGNSEFGRRANSSLVLGRIKFWEREHERNHDHQQSTDTKDSETGDQKNFHTDENDARQEHDDFQPVGISAEVLAPEKQQEAKRREKAGHSQTGG